VTRALLPLPANEAHLWYLVDDPPIEGAGLFSTYEAWLLPEERARRDRYYFEKNRREYLLTRALCRSVLSRYEDLRPEAWTFTQNEYGRPAIALSRGAWISFNLSNTTGLITCLVAREREVGVDVEDTARAGETVQVADRFFAPSEAAELRSLPESRQRGRFFDYWTLKEAYIKARGMGLAIPLEQFAFSLREARDSTRSISIAFDPRLADVPSTWQFFQHRPTPRHLISGAIRRGAGSDLRVVVRRTIPLVPEAEVIEPLGG